MTQKIKSSLVLAVKILVAVGLIAYMVKAGHLDPKDLVRLMTPFNVIIAQLLVGITTLVAAWRWIILLRARQIEVSLRYGFGLYLIGIFFNHALPGSVGGDMVRGYYLVSDHPQHRVDGILSILIDRILGLYSFFILTLIAVAFDFEFVLSHEKIRWVALACGLVFLGMTMFFLVLFSKRLARWFGLGFLERHVQSVHKIVIAFQHFGKRPSVIFYSIFVSLLCQISTMFFFYHIAISSGEVDVTWQAILFAVPMGFLVTAVPIAPAGIGVGQVAFSYLFQAYLQRPTQFGATAITAYQLTVVCWALLGAILYLKRRRPDDLNKMTAEMVDT